MKKSIALLALAFGVTGAFAQDLTSKKGEPMLPEAEDMAVSIDATPFFSYAKGWFGGNGGYAGAPTWNFNNNSGTIQNTIMVKKFKDAKTAYRAAVRLGFGNTGTKMMNTDRASTAVIVFPAQPGQVENKWGSSRTNIGVSVGMEMRRGKTRLQGYYGAEVGISLTSSKDKFTYGNALNPSSTTAPVVVDVDDEFNATINNVQAGVVVGAVGDSRMTLRKSGMGIGFGVRAFVGAEYFIFSKISIGGEFGWGLNLNVSGKSKTTWESTGFDAALNPVAGTNEIIGTTRSTTFGFDTDNNNAMWGPAASLKLNLHF